MKHPGFKFEMIKNVKAAKNEAEYKGLMGDVEHNDHDSVAESEPLIHLVNEMTSDGGFFLHESSTNLQPLAIDD
jgi:hypothetical protein